MMRWPPEALAAYAEALAERDALASEVEQLRERCAQSEHFKEEAEIRAEQLRAERDAGAT